jgi:hypothetical protein
MVKHFAQIKKMLMRGGALREFDPAPLGDEFGNGHKERRESEKAESRIQKQGKKRKSVNAVSALYSGF